MLPDVPSEAQQRVRYQSGTAFVRKGPVHSTALAIMTIVAPISAPQCRERLQQSLSSGSENDSDNSINNEADIDDTDLAGRLLTVQTYSNK